MIRCEFSDPLATVAPRPAPHLPPEATGSSFFRVEVVRMAEEGGGGGGGGEGLSSSVELEIWRIGFRVKAIILFLGTRLIIVGDEL